jgi:hypothetical protein
MIGSIALGVGDVSIEPGHHICAFYRGISERDAILIPYLEAGLRDGDKCVCVVDASDPATVLATLGPEFDARGAVADRQLDLFSSADTYLRGGVFRTEAMLDFWGQSATEAFDKEGYGFARLAGEMTWALRDLPGVDELVGYESALNRFLPRYPQVVLCLYDLDHFSGEILVDILKTHPKVLMGQALLDNPYYVDPDEFLAARE